MILLPAIDLYERKAVRLYKGDYAQMTVYSEDPVRLAAEIEEKGASFLHVVDLAGAKEGNTPALPVVKDILSRTRLQVEIGGGIRSFDAIDAYLSAGASRVILGTKAVTDAGFLDEAIRRFPDRIAVGVDARDGLVAVHGWTKTLDVSMHDFLADLHRRGVSCAIVTDISRDGAMEGTNLSLYRTLTEAGLQQGEKPMQLIASGGVSSYEDLTALQALGLDGAILGKAMYTGAVDVQKALAVLSENTA